MRARGLIGLPAVGRHSGRSWGEVREVLCDLDQGRLAAVRVARRRWPSRRRVLAYGGLGEAALLVEEPPLAEVVGDNLLGWRVLAAHGEELGTVGDLVVDERGMIQGYEVSGGLLQDLLGGRTYLAAASVVETRRGILRVRKEGG